MMREGYSKYCPECMVADPTLIGPRVWWRVLPRQHGREGVGCACERKCVLLGKKAPEQNRTKTS